MRLRYLELGLVFVTSIASITPPQAHQPDLPNPGLTRNQDGSWTFTVERLVPPGDYALEPIPPCPDDHMNRSRTLFDDLLGAVKGTVGVVLRAVPEFTDDLARVIGKQGGDLAALLVQDRYSSCTPIGVGLPEGSRALELTLTVGDGQRGHAVCDVKVASEDSLFVCERPGSGGVGHAAFTAPTADMITRPFIVTFRNWSHDRDRWASVSVRFVPPPGVTPFLPK